jgi:hypothetical protein
MNTKGACLTGILSCIFLLACAGARPTFEAFKINSAAEQQAIVKTLQDKIAEYDVYQCRNLSVFDPKHDDLTIIVPDFYCRPFVKQTKDDFVPIYEVIGIRTLVGPDGQLFGYATWAYQLTVVRAELVDAKTIRISQYEKPSGAPGRR